MSRSFNVALAFLAAGLVTIGASGEASASTPTGPGTTACANANAAVVAANKAYHDAIDALVHSTRADRVAAKTAAVAANAALVARHQEAQTACTAS
jgi:hypothetical protein